MAQILSNLKTEAVNLFFPPECLICRAPQQVGGQICYECFRQLEFVDESVCQSCGLPLEDRFEPVCAVCHDDPPAWSRLVAPFWYSDISRRIVFALKSGHAISVMNFIGAQMAGRIAETGDLPDIFIPIPSHIRRMMARGYNQSYEIGRELASVFSIPLEGKILQKIKHTKKQKGRDFRERFENQQDVFGLHKKEAAKLEGKHVGLIDDVFTSGATCQAATDVLLKAGAEKVSVFVFARAGFCA